MVLRVVCWISLIGAAVTLSALTAHALELHNNALGGPQWLAIQQSLYRGWGLFIGPFEATAMISRRWLVWLERGHSLALGLTPLASGRLSAALAVFFIPNAPVNAAFNSWTPATLPPDWLAYRLGWEAGHATSVVLVLIAFVALLYTQCRDAMHGSPREKRGRRTPPVDTGVLRR